MTSSKPSILVLGATGKVGKETARLLTQTGDVKVAAGVRSPEKAQNLIEEGIEVRHLDLDRQETIAPALEGIDRALLLTGYSDRHAGKIYPLGYDTATMQEVAEILTDTVGKPFQLDTRSPEDFIETMLKAGGDPAYMNCVYTQLKLNAANKIPCADATFNNFEEITGRKPMTWRDFADKHKAEFDY